MGVSTDAILVYGIPLEEEAFEEWADDMPEEGPAWLAYNGSSEDGIGVTSHCSLEYTMHILSISETEETAWRGHPKRIDPAAMKAPPKWARKLKAYAEAHKLKTAGEPGWWLCSMWG